MDQQHDEKQEEKNRLTFELHEALGAVLTYGLNNYVSDEGRKQAAELCAQGAKLVANIEMAPGFSVRVAVVAGGDQPKAVALFRIELGELPGFSVN